MSGRVPTLVGQHPERVVRGVALTDGVSHFEVMDLHMRIGGPWVKLRNMDPTMGHEGAWFRMEDASELAIAGNAYRIAEKNGWHR